MFSKTISAVLLGMRSDMITVEADVSGGLPYFEMVRLFISRGEGGEGAC